MDLTPDIKQYSAKAPTIEEPQHAKLLQKLIWASMYINLLIAAVLVFVGGASVAQCATSKFIGITLITSSIFLLTMFLTLIVQCMITSRRALILLSILDLIVLAIILVFEAATYRCTTETGDLDKFCTKYRETSNICLFFVPSKEADEDDEPTTMTSADGIPKDSFGVGRIVLIILTVIALTNSLIHFALLSVAAKFGKTVYLRVKRHKNSIVVGRQSNVILAMKNRAKNVEIIEARAHEEELYDGIKKAAYKEYTRWKQRFEAETKKPVEKGQSKKEAQAYVFDTKNPSTKTAVGTKLKSKKSVKSMSPKSSQKDNDDIDKFAKSAIISGSVKSVKSTVSSTSSQRARREEKKK